MLCSCQTDIIVLAELIAESLNINLLTLLKEEGFFELGILTTSDFKPQLLKGDFKCRNITNLRAICYFPNLTTLNCSFNSIVDISSIVGLVKK